MKWVKRHQLVELSEISYTWMATGVEGTFQIAKNNDVKPHSARTGNFSFRNQFDSTEFCQRVWREGRQLRMVPCVYGKQKRASVDEYLQAESSLKELIFNEYDDVNNPGD